MYVSFIGSPATNQSYKCQEGAESLHKITLSLKRKDRSLENKGIMHFELVKLRNFRTLFFNVP